MERIVRWQGFLGLLPFYHNRKFRVNSIYIRMVLLAYCLSYAYSVWGKAWRLKQYAPPKTHYVIFTLDSLIVFITILGSNYWSCGYLQQFFDNVHKIDAIAKKKYKKRHEVFQIVLTSVLLGVMIFGDFYISYCVFGIDLVTYHYYIHDHVERCYMFILLVFQYNLLSVICERLEFVNQLALELRRYKICVKADVDAIYKVYNLVVELPYLYNKMYEVEVLMLLMSVVLHVLIPIDSMLSKTYVWEISNMAVELSWTLFAITQGVVVATMCNKVTNEIRKTISLMYSLVLCYVEVPDISQKLTSMTQQTVHGHTAFTAAGFFDVNFKTIFTFANLITTYVIVLFQFSQNHE